MILKLTKYQSAHLEETRKELHIEIKKLLARKNYYTKLNKAHGAKRLETLISQCDAELAEERKCLHLVTQRLNYRRNHPVKKNCNGVMYKMFGKSKKELTVQELTKYNTFMSAERRKRDKLKKMQENV